MLAQLRSWWRTPSPFRERALLLQGRALARAVAADPSIKDLRDAEFSVFSQFGDDGIIQYLIHRVPVAARTFVEFGVQDYVESNTRFLLMNDNWSGFVMDGSARDVACIRAWRQYWKYDLRAVQAFVTRDNVNALLAQAGFGSIGLLHIDVDGVDYWIWEAVEASPEIVVIEYNSVLGGDRAIVVPHDPAFRRLAAHPSGLYWGASLPALAHLARRRGYALVGSNSAGNNAYFVRRDRLGTLAEVDPAAAYVESRYRESRDAGRLSYLRGAARRAAIAGLPVVNVTTGATEAL